MTTLYLTEPHAYVHRDHDMLVMRRTDGSRTTLPLVHVDQVVVMGDVTMSAGTIYRLLETGVEICFCTSWGGYRGRCVGDWGKNSLLRLAQYRFHEDQEQSLQLARAFVQAKLLNMRAMLIRTARRREMDIQSAADQLAVGADRVRLCRAHEELLGLEGAGSAAYFSSFGQLLLPPWTFTARMRRPPPDPVNALLSFGYTILVNLATSLISVVGLDPYLGCLHRAHYSKPSLALDLVEEFRPVIVDSTVLTLLNTKALTHADFRETREGIRLTDEARKRYLHALEERLNTQATHPITQHQATYRRCLELQARQVARIVLGETADYQPVRQR